MYRSSLQRHNSVAVLCCIERIQSSPTIMYLHSCIGTVSTLQYIYMPPKHFTRIHTGKLLRRAASVITSAEPISTALTSAVSSEAMAAAVT